MAFASFRHTIATVVLGAGAISSVVFTTNVANAATVLFTDTPFGANAPSKPYSSGAISLTFTSQQGYATSSGNGLCLYAQSSDSTNRCNTLDSTLGAPGLLGWVKMTNTSVNPIVFSGGVVKQIMGTPGGVDIRATPTGASLGTIAASVSPFTIASPINLAPNQDLYFVGSGTNSSLRVEQFSVQEVPGPLAILGLSSTVVVARRLRKKTKN
ncbi:MAG: hypothetical protein VKI63_04080 [Cyanobium sp.]|nr:hypothetical protein [Cyanobium sp.]